jgi:small multidrug resistance family-3 protein
MLDALVSALRYLPLLVVSALLEVGGDAGMRAGLQGRRGGYALGALLLIAYGLTVNLPRWDFGRLLGVYIGVFFVVSQVIAMIVFHEKLRAPTLVGGALIVAGGLVLALWHPK